MSYYFEGYDAAQRGEWYWDCPYHVGTAGFVYWSRGHAEARKERWNNMTGMRSSH